MHISEIGLCGGHSASGVWVDEHGATTVPGLYAAGDLACVPHNYMIGAFVFGDLAGTHAAGAARAPTGARCPRTRSSAAHDADLPAAVATRTGRRSRRSSTSCAGSSTTTWRRRSPPRSWRSRLETFQRMTGEIAGLGARTPHELMRCVEVTFIRDCAEMAARASLVRTESRWGLYHDRHDHPERDDADWFYHLNLRTRADGDDGVRQAAGRASTWCRSTTSTRPAGEMHRRRRAARWRPAPARRGPRRAPSRPRRPAAGAAWSWSVLALTEQPHGRGLRPFLADAEPDVRRTAVATLTEVTPAGRGGRAGRTPSATATPTVRVRRGGRPARARRRAAGRGRLGVRAARQRRQRRPGGPRHVVVELLRVTGLGVPSDFRAAARGRRRRGAPPGGPRAGPAATTSTALAVAAERPGPGGAGRGRARARHGRRSARRGRAAPAGRGPRTRWSAPPRCRPRPRIGCPGPIAAEAVRAARATRPGRSARARPRRWAAPTRTWPCRRCWRAPGDGNLDVRRAAVRSLAGWAHRDDVAAALRSALDGPRRRRPRLRPAGARRGPRVTVAVQFRPGRAELNRIRACAGRRARPAR